MEGRISIAIDPAGSSAARLQIVTGEPAPPADLERAMARAGVTTGIQVERLAEIGARLADPGFTCTGEVIAVGRCPVAGTDGEIQLHTEINPVAGTKRFDGSLDFRERHTVINVERNQLVAVYTPPTAGVAGITVRGTTLPAKAGADTLPELGPGVSLVDATEIIAQRQGVLSYVDGAYLAGGYLDGGLLDVTDLFKLDGDVDYDTGNLAVEGTVWVTGSVQPNFHVSATRDVSVDGNLDQCSVHAGANLTVGNGITGHVPGAIRADGNLACRFASNAHLSAGANLAFGDHSVGSELQASHIHCVDGKGRLTGGHARAEHSIHVREAGSVGEADTVLEVACPHPERAALRRRRFEERRHKRNQTKQAVRSRSGNGSRSGNRQRNKGGRGGRRATRVANEVRDQQRIVRRRELDLLATAEIVVTDTLHPGVRLRFGPHELKIFEPIGPARFVFDPHMVAVVRKELD